ncbi:BRO family protein [Caloramator proteoclasticus]|uniref:Prophage antirepressor n=1 Tax=Caloramator proteoclasticus DSM 10124 TaxID=1121262 RepID=A0A1M4ZH65_9CLOT|nr:BRO family protein [Caloramator proteoclasticus]SHF17298.1 Prophage antirepressor [Caloramator proteoclasticus DSM 10124]
MKDLKIIDEREVLGKKFRIYGTPEEPLFLAKDVAEWIEYDLSSVHKLVALVEDDEKVRKNVPTLGGEQEMWFLTEDGLYEVLMQSRKPIAKLFKKKVKEILKDIRKHGIYVTDKVLEKTLEDPDFMIELLTKYKEEKQRRLEAERINNILMHVNKTYTATEIAKELGFKSAIALNEDLEKKKIQFKQNGTWVLYSKYANRGYVEIKQEVLDNGKVIYHRRWTQLGREFLLKLYDKVEKEAM